MPPIYENAVVRTSSQPNLQPHKSGQPQPKRASSTASKNRVTLYCEKNSRLVHFFARPDALLFSSLECETSVRNSESEMGTFEEHCGNTETIWSLCKGVAWKNAEAKVNIFPHIQENL